MKRARTAAVPVWLLPITTTVPDIWYGCLDAAEQARATRFLRATDRSAFVAAHALVRALLASVGQRTPAEWSFTVDGDGKPRVAAEGDGHPPTFNIAHTPGMVAAVADPAGRAVGIDVEHSGRTIDPAATSRILTDDESRRFNALDPESARRELLQRWVLKEALAKATGQGIGLPFTRIGFECLSPPVVSFAPDDMPGRPDDWHIEAWCAARTYRVAVAVRCGEGTETELAPRTMNMDELSALLRRD